MAKAKEEWRDIAGYEGRYQVSDLGNVRNAKTKRKLKPFTQSTHDYLTVNLMDPEAKGGQRTYLVHRLVAEAFVEKPETDEKLEVNHLNFNKLDNRAENLEFCTHSRNMNWSLTGCSPISQYTTTGEKVATYSEMNEILKLNPKFNRANIHMSLNNTTRTAYGFVWRYDLREYPDNFSRTGGPGDAHD